jgi:hypothetical protein
MESLISLPDPYASQFAGIGGADVIQHDLIFPDRLEINLVLVLLEVYFMKNMDNYGIIFWFSFLFDGIWYFDFIPRPRCGVG